MGDLIAFRSREQATRKPAQVGSAQILFFTGVRYQRDEPETQAPASRKASPRESRGGRGHRRG